ncbi:hypothetical protein K9M42_02520 [Patescibacteria group bacterium]|nr:hypothetical protein [Patescibacteria group bacterium]
MFFKKHIKNKNALMKIIVTVIMVLVFIFWILVSYVFVEKENSKNNIFDNHELKTLKSGFSNTINDLSKKIKNN